MITRPKSSMPNRRFSNKLKQLSKNKTNATGNTTFNQSPKISSGKYRSLISNKSYFSILDVNEKLTNNKGPTLPIQFKRLISKEIKEFFKGDTTDTHKNGKKIKYTSMRNILLNRMNHPSTSKEIKKQKTLKV